MVAYKAADDALDKIRNIIKERHSKIADQIATGAGTRLMKLDSKIVKFVIQRFLKTSMPLMNVFDSFIAQTSQRDRLQIPIKKVKSEHLTKRMIHNEQQGFEFDYIPLQI